MNPKLDFDADTLACALALTGKAAPTPAALATALAEMYHNGSGPTVPDLLAAGWLVPTLDGHGLRVPPLPLAEQDTRLATYESKNALVPGRYHQDGDTPLLPAAHEIKSELVPEGLTELDTPLLPAGHESKAGLVPEGVSKLNTTSPPAAHEIKSELVPALADSRRISGIKPERDLVKLDFSSFTEEVDNRNTTGINTPSTPPSPRFSYYRGGIATTTPYAAITPAQLYTVLTGGRHRARTEALRAAAVGSPQRAELKKGLDYVTPAGTFTRRANDARTAASGLLVLDFDHVADVGAARAALLADALLAGELVLLFTSPSGDGLKAFVRTDPAAAHLDNFRAYAAYLGAHYTALGLVPDEAGKDVARACFVPYAPDAWLAPAYAA